MARSVIGAALLVAAATTADAATFQVFTDRGDFLEALGDNEAVEIRLSSVTTTAGLLSTSTAATDTDADRFLMVLDGSSPGDSTSPVIDFGTGAVGFSTQLSGVDPDAGLQVTGDFDGDGNADTVSVVDALAPRDSGFFGIMGTGTFTDIVFSLASPETADIFMVDRVTLATPTAAVPIPAGGALLISALGAFALLRRRG